LCAHSLITTVEEALRCNWGDQSLVKKLVTYRKNASTLNFANQTWVNINYHG